MEEELYQLATGLLRVVIAIRPQRMIEHPENLRQLGAGADALKRLNGTRYSLLHLDLADEREVTPVGRIACQLIILAARVNNALTLFHSPLDRTADYRKVIADECKELVSYLAFAAVER